MKADLRPKLGYDASDKNTPVSVRITYEYISEQGDIVKQKVEYKTLETLEELETA